VDETGAVTTEATTETGTGNPSSVGSSGASSRRARRWIVAGALAAVVVAFFAITGIVGLDAPGWAKRYPYGELSDLAARVNAEAGDLRTPDDCWRTLTDEDDGAERDPAGPLRDIAKVDYVRSRVVVRVYANESGRIDATTRRIVDERLESLFAASPEFEWQMVKLEPSPDGWSPLVSCRLVTRGWIFGF
jgi:hypothetical protein